MINAIIFSFDRAPQLHLLLESIERNAQNIFNINILYRYSNEEFKKSYFLLKERFQKINWIEEIDFKEQTLELMETELEYTCFFTDDDIIYNTVEEDDIVKCLKDINVFCFSFRLGFNVTYCYTMKCDNVLVPNNQDQKFVWWNWSKSYADFGYPLSVDGHTFRTKEIKKLVKAINFHNPNTLEGNLQVFDNFPKEIMVAYKRSCLVNSPNNIVNETHPNRKGDKYNLSVKELNDKYLNNEIINYESIDFSNIIGCHQEIEFKFKKI
jgi:hypothetical protein